MPTLIDYPRVEDQATADGLVSLYPNSGAFGFPNECPMLAVGWVGGEDPSIRPAARALARPVPPPYESPLPAWVPGAWRERLGGAVWVPPKSHGAYELHFGSHEWMRGLLREIGVAPE